MALRPPDFIAKAQAKHEIGGLLPVRIGTIVRVLPARIGACAS